MKEEFRNNWVLDNQKSEPKFSGIGISEKFLFGYGLPFYWPKVLDTRTEMFEYDKHIYIRARAHTHICIYILKNMIVATWERRNRVGQERVTEK